MHDRSRPGPIATVAESLVVELARAGDRQAFEELVRRRQVSVRNLMRRLCGNASEAEDLSQDVFVQAWRGLGALQSNVALWSWLRQIAVRTWLRARTRHAQNAVLYALTDRTTLPDVSDRIDLDAALAQLAPDVRLCIVLAYETGMSHSEIVAATAIPLGTVKSHVLRGTKVLRGLLDDRR